MSELGGFSVIRNDLLPPGTVLVLSPDAFRFLEPDRLVDLWQPATFAEEIREIVRVGIQRAFPDLVLPPRWRDPRADTRRVLIEHRLAMMVQRPEAMVRLTGL